MRRPQADVLVVGASTIVTCAPRAGDPLGRLAGGTVAIAGERIIAVGPAEQVAREVDGSAARVLDAGGKIVAPGFVDCHTHLVFGGSRVQEYALRVGRVPFDPHTAGVPSGIPATVAMTRAASAEELTDGALRRLDGMLRHGTTTAESKSGYGLSVADELRMLEVNRRLRALQPVDVVSTFLGAHDFPPEVPRARYVDTVIEEMIPRVAAEGLAQFCDVYCDDGYYSVDESRRILEAGRSAGLGLKIHADAYADSGGAELAAELGAVSADHLNYTPRAAMRRLAAAGVTGVVMPLLDFAVAHPRPFDAAAMFEEGLTLALATDLCPGCWAESMQLVMAFACRQYRFSVEEALLAATVGGARALGLQADRGSLETGKRADLQVWDLPTVEDVIYRLGNNAVETVIARGQVYEYATGR